MRMGSSQNYGPLLVIGSITAPYIEGYQNGTLILGITHVAHGFKTSELGVAWALQFCSCWVLVF